MKAQGNLCKCADSPEHSLQSYMAPKSHFEPALIRLSSDKRLRWTCATLWRFPRSFVAHKWLTNCQLSMHMGFWYCYEGSGMWANVQTHQRLRFWQTNFHLSQYMIFWHCDKCSGDPVRQSFCCSHKWQRNHHFSEREILTLITLWSDYGSGECKIAQVRLSLRHSTNTWVFKSLDYALSTKVLWWLKWQYGSQLS